MPDAEIDAATVALIKAEALREFADFIIEPKVAGLDLYTLGEVYKEAHARADSVHARAISRNDARCLKAIYNDACRLPRGHAGGCSGFIDAPDATERCNRCGVRGEHYYWCATLGFTDRDPQLCPGDGCPGCFHCTSTEGDLDADVPAERGRDVQRSDPDPVAGVEGQDGELAASAQGADPAELPGVVGRAGARLTRVTSPGSGDR